MAMICEFMVMAARNPTARLSIAFVGQFPFDKLVTSYAFEDINQACADVGSGKTVKAVLTM